MADTGSDTIDMQLSTSEVRGLSQPLTCDAVAEGPPPHRETPPPTSPPLTRRVGLKSLLVGAGMFLALVGATAYWGWMRNPSEPGFAAAASPAASTALPAQPALVRFANPFDADEVFEFPAGTSEMEAHDAVAKILLDRALERRSPVAVTASTR